MATGEAAAERSAEVRKIPKADRLLAAAQAAGHVARLGHGPVMEAVRGALDGVRARIFAGEPCPAAADIESALLVRLAAGAKGSLRRVINATGVVVHTNLGRAPLSEAALAAMAEIGGGYANLEYDLDQGERGDRYGHAAAALCRLTGAEDAVVVNNNAASVLIALAALCGARPTSSSSPEVIISRGQLVEIGGGFRIPDVLRRSGAALVEVGTTNRTYARDYEAALTDRTRMLLSVHRSNFRLSGFTADAALDELVALGRRHGLWVMDDLGSGTLLPTAPHGLGHEPAVQERVASGADLVCFSGDKLLGGPQAGLLVGRREAVALVKKHPLMRALRVDKVTLAGLAATLAHYERGEALEQIPVWRAIAQPLHALEARARGWREALGAVAPDAAVRESTSVVGGGSLPGVTLPTSVLALPSSDPDALAARLRHADPPVIGRIEDGAVALDPRTVLPGEDEALVAAVRRASAAPS
ncbi:MAG TPA: L-seryl-tRNA(Sec) selenium transferase [Anaeromyxobacteraceae bacterium]|nr:L-seryl-tRNA(Sec) selenium transferase [Anaeromyxobacteraceae bacterium]